MYTYICVCVYTHTRTHAVCLAIIPLSMCGESLCTHTEAEMGAASKEAAVRASCAFNCVCVCVCAGLCLLVCADENRVAVLHLKGTVINEMNKRP